MGDDAHDVAVVARRGVILLPKDVSVGVHPVHHGFFRTAFRAAGQPLSVGRLRGGVHGPAEGFGPHRAALRRGFHHEAAVVKREVSIDTREQKTAVGSLGDRVTFGRFAGRQVGFFPNQLAGAVEFGEPDFRVVGVVAFGADGNKVAIGRGDHSIKLGVRGKLGLKNLGGKRQGHG